MLVGDVRWATTGSGSSWKLSGGSPWSSGRRTSRRTARCGGDEAQRRRRRRPRAARRPSSGGGRLIHRATSGASSHSADERSGDPRRVGLRATTTSDRRDGREHRRRPPSAGRSRARSRSRLALACAAVGHSSRLPPGDVQPRQRAHDGVDHQPRLVGEERDVRGTTWRRGDRRCRRRRRAGGCAWRCPAGAAAARPTTGSAAGTITHASDERRPHARRRRRRASRRRRAWPAPAAATACGAGCRPSSSGRCRRCELRLAPAGRVARPAEDPGQELPVAARPAMLAGRRDQVVRRELVEQLDVGHQPGAGEDALEQVVAEQRVLGHSVVPSPRRTRRRRRSPCR